MSTPTPPPRPSTRQRPSWEIWSAQASRSRQKQNPQSESWGTRDDERIILAWRIGRRGSSKAPRSKTALHESKRNHSQRGKLQEIRRDAGWKGSDRRLVCPFLPVSRPFRILSPYGSDLGQRSDPFADPDCFEGKVEEKHDFHGRFGGEHPIFWRKSGVSGRIVQKRRLPRRQNGLSTSLA